MAQLQKQKNRRLQGNKKTKENQERLMKILNQARLTTKDCTKREKCTFTKTEKKKRDFKEAVLNWLSFKTNLSNNHRKSIPS